MNDEKIKAVKVKYKGVWHRSIAEARWHYKFDRLGGFATYEERNYNLNYKDRRRHIYTPDFHIKNVLIDGKMYPDLWVEVKGNPADLNRGLDKKMKMFAEQVGPIIVVFDNFACQDEKELRREMSDICNTYFKPVGLYSFQYIIGAGDYKHNNEAVPCTTKDGRFAVLRWNDKNIEQVKTAEIYDEGSRKFHEINSGFGKAWTKFRYLMYMARHKQRKEGVA